MCCSDQREDDVTCVCCSVLQCVAACSSSVLQCVAVMGKKMTSLVCIAVCCSV